VGALPHWLSGFNIPAMKGLVSICKSDPAIRRKSDAIDIVSNLQPLEGTLLRNIPNDDDMVPARDCPVTIR